MKTIIIVCALFFIIHPAVAQEEGAEPIPAQQEQEFIEEEEYIEPIVVGLNVSGDHHLVWRVEEQFAKELNALDNIIINNDVPEYVITIVVMEASLKTGRRIHHISMSVLVEDRYGKTLKPLIGELIDERNEGKWERYIAPVFDDLVMIQGNTLYLTSKDSLPLTCKEAVTEINANIFDKICAQKDEDY